MTAKTFLLVLLLATLSSGASAQGCPGAESAALAWIGKMSNSIAQHSYQGVVTLQRADDMQVMQVSHTVSSDSSSETLTRLNGQGAHVERSEHPLNCIHPGHQLLMLGTDLEAGHCEITRQYQFSMATSERVAGRRAVRIRIEPRDMYRFGYMMSLDKETGLLLKTEVIGQDHRTLEKFQFANLSYDPYAQAPSEVDVVHKARHPHPDISNASSSLSREWRVSWLPRGFIPTDSATGTSGRRTYTDGLAVFSVFLEDLDHEIRPGEGQVRRGGTTSYTRGLRLEGQPVLVTVIGEVPINTARMVADKIAWVQ